MKTLLVLLLLLSAGCRCRKAERSPDLVQTPHYGEWEVLIGAWTRGDLHAVQTMARDLTEGAPVEGDEDAAADLGGALGFLQLADEASVPTGLVRAAEACGACHAEVLSTRERPPYDHATAAQWILHGLVWGEPTAPPASPLEGPAAAYHRTPDTGGEPDDTRRAIAFLEACGVCH